MQRLLLLGAFVLGAILLIVVLVQLFRAIFSSGGKDDSALSGAGSDVSAVSLPPLLPVWPVAEDPSVWNLVYVSPTQALPGDFRTETVSVTAVGHTFDSRAAQSLKDMVSACNAIEGNSLTIISGYRGRQTQNDRHQALVDNFVAQGNDQASATAMANRTEPPYGYSEHQTGLAVDFSNGVLNDLQGNMAFAETPEYAWLIENAHNYGFILRYPQGLEEYTNMDYQPYLFRYVGVDEAAAIKNSGITLDQYVGVVEVPGVTSVPPATEDSVAESAA